MSVTARYVVACGVSLLALTAGQAKAEWKPTKSIEFVVTAGPGGGTDNFARAIQNVITKHKLIDQPIVVVNKPGGSGAEGYIYEKSQAGDPHKVVFGTSNAWQQPMVAKLAYDYTDLTSPSNVRFSPDNPMGTDTLGHDLFAQVMRGMQQSLKVAFITTVLSTGIGAPYGAIAGYFGGRIDTIMMRICDVLLTLPLFLIAGALVTGRGGSVVTVGVVLGLLGWVVDARVVRSVRTRRQSQAESVGK